MATSDDLRSAVYQQPITPRDRLWTKIQIYMTAMEIANYAPSKSVYQGGTVQVPIRLLRQLADAVEEYQDHSDESLMELPFHVRLREAVRFLWK